MERRRILSWYEFSGLTPEAKEALRFRVSLSDFTGLDRFVAVCRKCGRGRIIHPGKLKKRFGQERVARLEQKLRCDHCGNRLGNRFYWAEAEE